MQNPWPYIERDSSAREQMSPVEPCCERTQ